jgi:lipid II:glycine glycyltransferase (peptidoglycan interpeptide bridge formation enzyme)
MTSLSNKDKYRIFCQEETLIPIFMQDWWLDAVCIAGQWDVCLEEQEGKVVAAWPYYLTRTWGLPQINMPLQTKFSGPWLKYPKGLKYHSQLAWEKEIIQKLISQLPKVVRFRENFHYGITNWLPWHWKGFKQTTGYSYRLDQLSNLEEVKAGFNENVKRNLNKAKNQVQVVPSENIEEFIQISSLTASKRNIANNYPKQLIHNIEDQSAKRNRRLVLKAVDVENNIHAMIYLVWDNTSVYYLMSGTDERFQKSGAFALLIWEGIQHAAKLGLAFDFEGSMIEGVEQFFRSFNAKQYPYFYVTKTDSKLIQILEIFDLA